MTSFRHQTKPSYSIKKPFENRVYFQMAAIVGVLSEQCVCVGCANYVPGVMITSHVVSLKLVYMGT